MYNIFISCNIYVQQICMVYFCLFLSVYYVSGTICVIIGFPLLFMNCFGCYENTEEYIKLIYYAPLVVIFQFGWASTQINHLALIPDLTNNDGEKVTLNAFRLVRLLFY